MGRLYIDSALSERRRVFSGRTEAGEALARMLAPACAGRSDAAVLAIPAGGVPVGLAMAKALGLAFDLIFIRKIHFPDNPETGFGALSEHGEILLNPQLARMLDEAEIARQIRIEEAALKKRVRLLRREQEPLDLTGMTAIITDDGLASGFTMLAAAAEARRRGAREVIVAVPTASRQAVELLADAVEEIHVANLRSGPCFAVADAYVHWRDLELEEVREMLRRRAKRAPDARHDA